MKDQRKSVARSDHHRLGWVGALAFCVGGLGLHSPSIAETVTIPLGQQGKAWDVTTPAKGTSKTQVEAQFGAPAQQSGPVGTPPIYTWNYGDFTVYFEGDKVIHSVVKAPPKQDALQGPAAPETPPEPTAD